MKLIVGFGYPEIGYAGACRKTGGEKSTVIQTDDRRLLNGFYGDSKKRVTVRSLLRRRWRMKKNRKF
jgi:hypothetical protein